MTPFDSSGGPARRASTSAARPARAGQHLAADPLTRSVIVDTRNAVGQRPGPARQRSAVAAVRAGTR